MVSVLHACALGYRAQEPFELAFQGLSKNGWMVELGSEGVRRAAVTLRTSLSPLLTHSEDTVNRHPRANSRMHWKK